MSIVCITGCSSGLGLEIAKVMNQPCNFIWGVDMKMPDESSGFPINEFILGDLANPGNVAGICTRILRSRPWPLDILINCAGINHIAMLEDLNIENWDRVMNVNARAIYLMTRGLLPALTISRGTVLNIVSNASHVPMTSSLAYNASKGAAHIMTLQLARELTRERGITVFGISPNKMKGTEMSRYIEGRVCEVRGWTQEHAEEYQRKALLTGEETDPAQVAEFIGHLLSEKRRHKYLSGCVIPYGV